MELKAGYKPSEVGLIPDGWEVKSIQEFSKIQTGPFGTLLAASEYSVYEGVPLISVGEIGAGYFKVTDHTPRIPAQVIRRLPQYVLRVGDIVFGRKGAVERSAIVTEDEEGWFLGSDGISIRPNEKLHAPYLAVQFQRHEVQSWLLQNAVGTTMASLNQGILGNVKIPIPPISEQQAISEALSDTDTLIYLLEQLLTKKRQIKQGAKQELLSGQRRLPGFSLDWTVTTLGSICHIKTGARNNQDKHEDGDYPFFVRSATVERVNSYSYDCEAILVPGEGGIGSIFHYVNGKFDVHQRVYAITQFSPDVSGRYIYLYMSEKFGVHAMQNSVKATVDSLRLPTFLNFEIKLPSTLDEQVAIATVLTTIDNDITTLETKLQKARHLKQGMMQELLTGRIRLV